VAWTKTEREFLEINYLRLSNEQLAQALGKTEVGVASQLRKVESRTVVRAREKTWDLPFGCQVTDYLPELSELDCCGDYLQEKGVPYIICQGDEGFAIFRSIIGNDGVDGEEPDKSTWVKCHNHPVYDKALP